MSLAALALVVSASLFHATWNLLAKRAAAAGAAFVFAYTLFCCLVYAPWVVWLIAHRAVPWSGPIFGCIVLSGLIHLCYSLSLQRGYQVADLSVVYPVARGSAPLLSSLGAFLVLREPPTSHEVLGLAAVIVGIALISTQGDLSAFKRPGGLLGIRWGAATGALIAAYTVVDAYSVKKLGLPPVVANWSSDALRFVALAPVVARNQSASIARMRGFWPLAAAVGVLLPLAYVLVLSALDMGAPLSVVAPAREMSMMVGALLGMVVLHEPVGRWRLAGCAVMIGGVLLLGAA